MVRTTTHHAVILLGLLLLAGAVYAPLRDAPFVYEDVNWMPQAQAGLTPVELKPSRTLTHATFHWTYVHFNFDPTVWHLTNVGLHLMNGVLVYGVTTALLGATVALGAAGLFLLHPLNSEAVSYVTGRADLLATFFVLTAVWCVLGRRQRVLRGIGCLLALAGAITSKETGVVGVPLVLVTVWCWRRASVPWLSPTLAVLWITVGVGAGAVWDQARSYMVMSGTTSGSFLSVPEYAVLQAGMVWKFLVMSLLPMGLTIDHDVMQFGPAWLVLSALGIAVALSVAALAVWKKPAVAWPIAWVALALAPRFVVRTNEFLHEYQTYLALVGVWIALAVASTTAWNALSLSAESGLWTLYRWKANSTLLHQEES